MSSTTVDHERTIRLDGLRLHLLRDRPATSPAPRADRRGRSAISSLRSMATGATDAELVARIRAGDRMAFGELFARHRQAVLVAVAARVRDRERQADLVQETFVKALARLETLRQPDRFRPWLFQIARNAAVDDLRRCSAARHEPLDDVHPIPEHEQPSAVAEGRRLRTVLVDAMTRLPKRESFALALIADQGRGIEDVAAALEVTPNNAKVIVHRARRRLRALTPADTIDGTSAATDAVMARPA